jgi:hypothetical protein
MQRPGAGDTRSKAEELRIQEPRSSNESPKFKQAGRRSIFTLRLRPEKGVDPIRALRGALKILLRKFGLRTVSVEEGGAP